MIIRRAHEAPISQLDNLYSYNDYEYCLVHLLDQHPEYLNFFKTAIACGKDVLLDNSIFELGTAYNAESFIKWIEQLQPTYYVVPDKLEEGYATCSMFDDFLQMIVPPVVRIGVVQGKTYNELSECYKYMSSKADYIALSFDLSYYEYTGTGATKLERQCTGRQRLVKQLIVDGFWNHNKPHHLLGCSLAREFKFYTQNNIKSIYSCDTSNPVVAAIKGYRYSGEFGLNFKPQQKLHELIDYEMSDDQLDDMHYNIKQFGKIVAGE
jgi:hypothetical protein